MYVLDTPKLCLHVYNVFTDCILFFILVWGWGQNWNLNFVLFLLISLWHCSSCHHSLFIRTPMYLIFSTWFNSHISLLKHSDNFPYCFGFFLWRVWRRPWKFVRSITLEALYFLHGISMTSTIRLNKMGLHTFPRLRTSFIIKSFESKFTVLSLIN